MILACPNYSIRYTNFLMLSLPILNIVSVITFADSC